MTLHPALATFPSTHTTRCLDIVWPSTESERLKTHSDLNGITNYTWIIADDMLHTLYFRGDLGEYQARPAGKRWRDTGHRCREPPGQWTGPRMRPTTGIIFETIPA